MSIWEAILLGIIEGITEFLPVSSTGHLTIAEKLLGHAIDSPDITAFTVIIQMGAVLAVIWYFRRDIRRLAVAWCTGLVRHSGRNNDYRFGWSVIVGSIPIGVIGLLFKDQIETTLRSLWFVGASLVVWSLAMWLADRSAVQGRREQDVTWKDTMVIGLSQCLALVPGVSRSGATMAAGLTRGLDRVAVTKLSFFLSIPALFAAGLFQLVSEFDAIGSGVGWAPTAVATIVSFVAAYVSVAWLLSYVSKHSFTVFIVYRLVLGSLLLGLLAAGAISAT